MVATPFKIIYPKTSTQDGGIGRYSLPPCTTKRRTTTNLKTKYNQTCQKTELYESTIAKKLKKKHSSRPVGGEERNHGKALDEGPGWARWLLADQPRQWLADWAVPHLHVDKLGRITGEQDRPCNPEF